METFRKARVIARHNFISWRQNDRVMTVFGVTALLILVYMGRIPFFGIAQRTDNSLFLLPFLFTIGYNANGSLKVLLLFAVILLFSEAPFLTDHKIYLLIRSKRKAWWMGEVLYIVCASLIYMLFLSAVTTLIALPRSTLKGWGQTILIGAYGSSETVTHIWRGIFPDPVLIREIRPANAFLYTFFSGWLVFCWLGLFIDCINLFSRKEWLGVSLAVLIVLTDPVLRWFGTDMDKWFLFSPASWCTMTTLSTYAHRGYLTGPMVFLLLIAEIGLMLILIAKRSQSLDIAEWQEV